MKYVVEWRMGGEFTFESDEPREQISQFISTKLDGIAVDVADDTCDDFGVEMLAGQYDGTGEFTLRSLCAQNVLK